VPAVPPIKYGLGYRSRTLTLKLTLTLTLKVTKIYAVQNDTGIKVNTELYIKVIFVGQGWVYKRPTPGRWNKTATEVITVTEPEVWDTLI